MQKLLLEIISLFANFEVVKKWSSYGLKLFLYFVGPISFIILVMLWLNEDMWKKYPEYRLEETSCSTWLNLKNDDCE